MPSPGPCVPRTRTRTWQVVQQRGTLVDLYNTLMLNPPSPRTAAGGQAAGAWLTLLPLPKESAPTGSLCITTPRFGQVPMAGRPLQCALRCCVACLGACLWVLPSVRPSPLCPLAPLRPRPALPP